MIDKRKNPVKTDEELYKVSDIDNFIKTEKRKDELDRLREVKEQKKVWTSVVVACIALNLILVVFAVVGYLQNV